MVATYPANYYRLQAGRRRRKLRDHDSRPEIMGLLVISTLSIAMITVIACVHSGYITVTMTATATAIVQTTLTLTTTLTTLASSSASRCNSSTAAQPLKLRALPPGSCVVQLLHKCQNHSTSRGAHRRLGNVGEKQRSMVSKEEEAKEARERGESWERLGWYIRFRLSVASAVGE